MPLNLPQFTFHHATNPTLPAAPWAASGTDSLRRCAVLPDPAVEAPDTTHIHFPHIHIHLPMKSGARIAAIAVLNN